MTQETDRGLGGRKFQDAVPETENDCGPRVDVNVPGVDSLLASAELVVNDR